MKLFNQFTHFSFFGFLCILLTTFSLDLNAQCAPQANFTFDELPTCGRVFEPILNPSIEYVSHTWDFGDGSDIATAERGMHVYSSDVDNSVPLTVVHTVTTDTGQSFTCQKSITDQIECAGRWKATFYVDCGVLKGDFFTHWYPNNGPGVINSSITWDFGDGQTGIGNSVSHSYANISTLNGATPEFDISMQYTTFGNGVSPILPN